ncbi:MAG: hypothetical protein R2684_17610 [Pyrinomonadaceae bacterium]
MSFIGGVESFTLAWVVVKGLFALLIAGERSCEFRVLSFEFFGGVESFTLAWVVVKGLFASLIAGGDSYAPVALRLLQAGTPALQSRCACVQGRRLAGLASGRPLFLGGCLLF